MSHGRTLTETLSQIFQEREAELKRRSIPLDITCFRTSIWDETLYKCWSSIVVSLIPNVGTLESHLENFGQILEADEVGVMIFDDHMQ